MQVFIIAALTADGFIGQDAHHRSTRWTSKEDSAWFQRKTIEAGVVIVGRKTFETFGGKPLAQRLNVVLTSEPNSIAASDQVWATAGSPQEVLAELANRGFTSVAVCGGASVYTQFLQAGVVEKLYLTTEPVIFGDGVRLFNQPLGNGVKLELIEHTKLSDQTRVSEYRIVGS